MTIAHPSGERHWTHREPDRVLRGTAAPGAKLSEYEIRQIIAGHYAGESQSALARAYGVSRITIWRHLKARGHV